MRIVLTFSVILLSTVASQAFACDRHGGVFGQFDTSSWNSYEPAQSEADRLLLETTLSKWHQQNDAVPAKTQRAKPTFSKVSSRASIAAQTRLATQAGNKKYTDKVTVSSTPTKSSPEVASR